MVGGSVVADRCLDKDAERLAAWRRVLSEFAEEALSSLIQTGESFSSNLKHGPMVGDGRALRYTAVIDPGSVLERHLSIRFLCVRWGSFASEWPMLFNTNHATSVGPEAWQ